MPFREWEDAKKLVYKISHKYLLLHHWENLITYSSLVWNVVRYKKANSSGELAHTKLQQIFNHNSKVCHQDGIQ